ncbi:tRNA (mo5U34)-methyltransferase [Spirochaetota bacterium]|nr:tRNA (mo5U34)-methyltransferase [Spirochaetota bacterium]
MLENTLGTNYHHFFEKSFITEWALLKSYKNFYKNLATLLSVLPTTQLVLKKDAIHITTSAHTENISLPLATRRSNLNAKKFHASEHPTTITFPAYLTGLLKALIPWRKGPYNILGHLIESEWRSSLKWERIKPVILPYCNNKCIIDVGANNGYFMYRLAESGAKWVLGLEPTARYVAQYDLLRTCLITSSNHDLLANHYLSPLGYEALDYFEARIDIILLLGILYHHPNPLAILRQVHRSLKKGGSVIIDCQGISDEQNIALFPSRTYTKKRGFWFLPTRNTLIAWLSRTGFQNIDIFYENTLTAEEQRRSVWAPFPSLSEGLSPQNSPAVLQTSEKYPPPIRYYLTAHK